MNRDTPIEEKREWIERILLDLRNGHGSISEVTELRTLLAEDQEARLIYLESNQLDGMLESTGLATEAAPPRRLPAIRRDHVIGAAVGAGIAALLLLALIIGGLLRPGPAPRPAHSSDQPVASFLSGLNAIIDGKAAVGNRTFGTGSIPLDRGIAHLAFRNGTQIVLEGDCSFEIIDEMSVTLTHGKMWAYCPEDAHGFKVLTPGGREIIDLGTEFGIEVTTSGATDVHVFDGLVDVITPDSEPQRLTAGSALTWASTDASANETTAKPDHFVSATSLAGKRFLAYRQYITSRDDLLLHYDFSQSTGNRSLNTAPNPSIQSHGLIRGASTVRGRFNGSKALQFENPGDRVELEMDHFDDLPGCTTAVWLKVDRFDADIVALVNSNNWEPGTIHFQVGRDGRLKSGINGGPSVRSNPGYVSPGKWHLVAVSWNFETMEAQVFCDGLPVPSKPGISSPQRFTLDPQLGPCQIGAWTETRDHRTERELKRPRTSREFRGRIDEVMIFDHALTEREIAALHRAGRP